MQILRLLVPKLNLQRTLIVLPDVAPGNAIPRITLQTFPTLQLPHRIEENVARFNAVIVTIFTSIVLYLPSVYGVGQYGVMRVIGPTACTKSILPLMPLHRYCIGDPLRPWDWNTASTQNFCRWKFTRQTITKCSGSRLSASDLGKKCCWILWQWYKTGLIFRKGRACTCIEK